MRTATAAILVSQDVTLVDLDGTGFRGAAPDDPDAKRWRTIVAKEIKARKLFFKDERQFLLCETGQETTRKNAGSTRGWRRTGELHTPEGLKQIMERENRATMDLLVAQLRSPMGVVPFVGAGLSIDFGFPSWDSFLSEAAQFCSKPDEVQEKIQAGALIDAATDLFKDSPERFQRLVARWFGGEVGEDQVRAGSVGLLPLVASGPVITTNFDRVLEAAFRAAGTPFEHVVTGQEPEARFLLRPNHRMMFVPLGLITG